MDGNEKVVSEPGSSVRLSVQPLRNDWIRSPAFLSRVNLVALIVGPQIILLVRGVSPN
jgi:hypothetical protein